MTNDMIKELRWYISLVQGLGDVLGCRFPPSKAEGEEREGERERERASEGGREGEGEEEGEGLSIDQTCASKQAVSQSQSRVIKPAASMNFYALQQAAMLLHNIKRPFYMLFAVADGRQSCRTRAS